MTCIQCQQDRDTNERLQKLAELLRAHSHELPGAQWTEAELHDYGLFRGAIERIRGQYSSDIAAKKQFGNRILTHLQDEKLVGEFQEGGRKNRFNYLVDLPSGRTAFLEMKGCLDGENTNRFERPSDVDEFYIWSVCQNAAANPRKNAWSGIHSRLGAEIIRRDLQIDALIIWDMVCGTVGRPCPKLAESPTRKTIVGPYELPPPCLYRFPTQRPSESEQRPVGNLEFLNAMASAFKVVEDEIYSVEFETRNSDSGRLQRRTIIRRAGTEQQVSHWNLVRGASG